MVIVQCLHQLQLLLRQHAGGRIDKLGLGPAVLRYGADQFIGVIVLKPHTAVSDQGADSLTHGDKAVSLLNMPYHIPDHMAPSDSKSAFSQVFQIADSRLSHRIIGGMVIRSVPHHHSLVNAEFSAHLLHQGYLAAVLCPRRLDADRHDPHIPGFL